MPIGDIKYYPEITRPEIVDRVKNVADDKSQHRNDNTTANKSENEKKEKNSENDLPEHDELNHQKRNRGSHLNIVV
jgi:hypothetical protein